MIGTPQPSAIIDDRSLDLFEVPESNTIIASPSLELERESVEAVPRPMDRPCLPAESISALLTGGTIWLSNTQLLTEVPQLTGGTTHFGYAVLAPNAASEFVDAIWDNLCDDLEDADTSDEPRATNAAINTCLDIARRIAYVVTDGPVPNYAAFTRADGGVSLVLQSLVSHRRVEFTIGPEGISIEIHDVNEKTEYGSIRIGTADSQLILEKARWVKNL